MVKCPRGTPSQINANLAHINGPSVPSSGYDVAKGQLEKESETLIGESEGSELDSIKADKRCPPTARDELVYFFINSFLDILLESWEGKPCVKQKLGPQPSFHSEEFGEDLGSCDPSTVSFTAEYLKDLYQKRSDMSKEKLKKDSESTESEYMNEEDFESPPDQWKTLMDEDVHFVLLNGVWYKGRVSRRLMEGEGYYFWEDGTTFQGEFEAGCATGKGRLEFPDLSVYEGGVYRAFRHGEGMFCFSGSPVMYSGQWWLGKKHGYGLIVYTDPSESHNFYKGQWQDGVKEGFGFRQYPSGAKYVGFWSNGQRHGRGIMFWSNHDIYRGEWKEGLMHGYGEYTWNGFINKSLSYPAANIYRGYWEEGKRNGGGVFELKSGPLIETNWVKNMKEGPGIVTCENGSVFVSEKLFLQDKPILQWFDENKSLLDENVTNKKSKLEDPVFTQTTSSVKLKVTSIPISSPVHKINLYPHIHKLFFQLNKRNREASENVKMDSEIVTVTPKMSEGMICEPQSDFLEFQNFITTQQLDREEAVLRNYITMKICPLRHLYSCYSKLPCHKPPPFKCILLRLFLWQMLIDGGIPNPDLSLIDVDDLLVQEQYILIQERHDPFERIQLWQFIHILLVLSWHLYGKYVHGERLLMESDKLRDFLQHFGRGECKNVLKTAFEYFVEKHLRLEHFAKGSSVLPSDRMNKFEESDFAPMEAMYMIYCNLGNPHSVRDFVNAVCEKRRENGGMPTIVRYFEKLPFYKVEGKNAFTVAGELEHIPGDEPFNIPEIFQLERQEAKADPKSELTCFNGLKARRVMRCLKEVCPGMVVDDCIVNMDYKLTFLEFYKAITLCTKLQLKIKAMNDMRDDILAEYKVKVEEYKKQLSEFEKQKENPVVSRKRSRQFSELSKKGRK